MSQIGTAKRQIARHGFKGAAQLILVTTVNDRSKMEVAETESTPIALLSYVGGYGSSRIDGKVIFANDRKVLAAPDIDWDGTVEENSKIEIEGLKYSIVNFSIKRYKENIAYVEIQCRG